MLLGPLIVVGGADYPPIAWRTGILFIALSGVIGITMQALVAHVRDQEHARDDLLSQLETLAHTDVADRAAQPARRGRSSSARGLARAARTREPVSVALIDIDSFKAVNDLRGHAGGDRLLIDVARLWTEVLRPDDVLARIGGDEFAIVMPACTEAEAAEVLVPAPRPHARPRAPARSGWPPGTTPKLPTAYGPGRHRPVRRQAGRARSRAPRRLLRAVGWPRPRWG